MKKPAKKGRRAAKTASKGSASRAVRRTPDGMRVEYDFRGGVRGKYAARFQAGSNVVVPDPDVAAAFKDGQAVNHALRTLLEVIPASARSSRRTA